MNDFRDPVGRKIELFAKDEIDVEHRAGVVFVEFIKAILDAHIPFGAIRRFGVHNVEFLQLFGQYCPEIQKYNIFGI